MKVLFEVPDETIIKIFVKIFIFVFIWMYSSGFN